MATPAYCGRNSILDISKSGSLSKFFVLTLLVVGLLKVEKPAWAGEDNAARPEAREFSRSEAERF